MNDVYNSPSIVERSVRQAKRPSVVLRADGNAQIGLGHISRCMALAEMLSVEFDCVFVTKNIPKSVEYQINKVCKGLYEIPVRVNTNADEVKWIGKHLSEKGNVFILDGYHFELMI